MKRTSRTVRPKIDDYEVRDAVNTVARARQHLSNPKMVKAMKSHLDQMNEAVTGALKPRKFTNKARIS